MKRLVPVILVALVCIAKSETITMVAHKKCSLDTTTRNVQCESNSDKIIVKREKENWYVKYEAKDFYKLNIRKEDKHVIIFSQDVYFSGTREIYLYKVSKRFTLSEIAYSEILNNDEVVITIGKYTISL